MVWIGVFQIVLCIAVVCKLNINQQLRFICKLPMQYLFYILSPVTNNPDVPVFIKKPQETYQKRVHLQQSGIPLLWKRRAM